LESIDEAFAFEFQRLVETQADAFPVGSAGQAVPYTFYTYPAGDDHARGFDPTNLLPNVLYGQRFEDGSVFIIYSSGESRAGLNVSDKLALYQKQQLPAFEEWWSSMPQKASLALEFLPAARNDEAYRLAAALMQIPFTRMMNYAVGELGADVDQLHRDLEELPESGIDEVFAIKQKLALLILLSKTNSAITHPYLQSELDDSQPLLKSELYDPLTYQNDINSYYEQAAAEDETPLVMLPMSNVRIQSTLQSLAEFGIVPTTYQHVAFELTPEILMGQAEYLIGWLESGEIHLFQQIGENAQIDLIEIDVDGSVSVLKNHTMSDQTYTHLFAVPGNGR
jgi:hypothetical protein